MEIVKKLAELIPFLAPYPPWVKILVSGWALLTTILLLALVFAKPKDKPLEPLRLSGRIMTPAQTPVPVASIELLTSTTRTETVADSEGDFRVEVGPVDRPQSARVRVSASGYRTYERNVEIHADKPDLGTFTLQPDVPTGVQFTPDEIAAVEDATRSYKRVNSRGIDPTRDQVCDYLDSVAAEADQLAAVWREIGRNLNANHNLDVKSIVAAEDKYQVVPRPNEPFFSDLRAFLYYLPQAMGNRLDPALKLEVTNQLTQLLQYRNASDEALQRYLQTLSQDAASSTADHRTSLGVLNKAIADVQTTAANLHALAKAVRAAGAIPHVAPSEPR